MKVTINRRESEKKVGGFFSSKKVPSYGVSADILFSETELAVIRKRHLGDAVVYTRKMEIMGDLVDHDYTIDSLIKGKNLNDAFSTPMEANDFENELKTKILPSLKNYIEGNADSAPKTESFEL